MHGPYHEIPLLQTSETPPNCEKGEMSSLRSDSLLESTRSQWVPPRPRLTSSPTFLRSNDAKAVLVRGERGLYVSWEFWVAVVGFLRTTEIPQRTGRTFLGREGSPAGSRVRT